MTPDQVFDAFLGTGHGALFRSAMLTLALIPERAFSDAITNISREAAIGPFFNPTAYLDGTRFDNARDYQRLFESAGRLRAMLTEIEERRKQNEPA